MALSCKEICYEIVKPRFTNLTYKQFKNSIKDFDVIDVEIDGELVGAILKNGTELHALVLEKARGRWFGKKALKVINDTIKEHGKATTKVLGDYQMGHDFAIRLGFKVEQVKDGITHYIKV